MSAIRSSHLVALSLPLAASAALAQQPAVQQVVKPPVAQAWIDIATGAGFGMPAGGAGGANPMAMMGGLFGGGRSAGNSFGQTAAVPAGRWVDVTLYTRNNPQLAEAQQAVPAGFLNPALKLQSPRELRGGVPPEPGDERVVEPEFERPKGRMLLYWGCGDTIRTGQPRVVDFATATPADLARFFQSRRATQRGTHAAPGRPSWPSRDDTRMVPDGASLAGEHLFTGAGVPEGFRFQIATAQDLMPPIALKQQDQSGATRLDWQALPTARAYFISGMGAKAGGKGDNEVEMVLWTSSEQPEVGFGLMDYQTNSAVDRWLKEQVLLAPRTTTCTVPKGVFTGEGAMLRMIAYGSELNLAHPPRPTDPKIAWEPQWAVKLRVKSQTTAMLGMEMPAIPAAAEAEPGRAPAKEEKKPDARDAVKEGVKDVLKGLFGR